MRSLILGGPGAGKTTRLINLVIQEADRLGSADQIAFVSFTNAAADEAKERALAALGLEEDDLPGFRTIHSAAYRSLIDSGDLSAGAVPTREEMSALCDATGERMSAYNLSPEMFLTGSLPGDAMMGLVQYSRSRGIQLEEAYRETGLELHWRRVERFASAYEAMRAERSRVDFSDMLDLYLEIGEPSSAKVAFIDEAQDLTPKQWAVVDKMFARAQRIYYAGDDDQAIYRWAGADIDKFLSLPVDSREVLPLSHRLTPEVFSEALRIVKKLGRRYDKVWDPRSGKGTVEFHRSFGGVPFESDGWFVLARNRHLLDRAEYELRQAGFLYIRDGEPSLPASHREAIEGWEILSRGDVIPGKVAKRVLSALGRRGASLDPLATYGSEALGIPLEAISAPWHEALKALPLRAREYYRAAERRGERRDSPRIELMTVHAAKGREASKVLVLTDFSKRTFEAYRVDPDSEHRVWYVAATRARDELHVMAPGTPTHYDWPKNL